MSKKTFNRTQAKQICNGCEGKVKYKTEKEAENAQPHQANYLCIFCNHWHCTMVKVFKDEPQRNKNKSLTVKEYKEKITEYKRIITEKESAITEYKGELKYYKDNFEYFQAEYAKLWTKQNKFQNKLDKYRRWSILLGLSLIVLFILLIIT